MRPRGGGPASEARLAATGRLFVYGTLRDPVRMHSLIGEVPPSEPAILAGWRCEWVRGETFPGIAPDAEGRVEGDLCAAIGQ